jgi:hypothetical protein
MQFGKLFLQIHTLIDGNICCWRHRYFRHMLYIERCQVFLYCLELFLLLYKNIK